MARSRSPLLLAPTSLSSRVLHVYLALLPFVLIFLSSYRCSLVPIRSINVSLNFPRPGVESSTFANTSLKKKRRNFVPRIDREGERDTRLACKLNCGGNRKLIAPDKLINAFGRNYVGCNSAGVPAVSLERRGKMRHEGRIENGIMDVDNERGMGDRKPPFPRLSFFLPFFPSIQSSSPELVIYATRINYSSL